MSQNEFDDTLQQIQRLSPRPHQPLLSSDAVRSATDFIERVRGLMTDASGRPWQTPLVEDGGGGAVVLLWQDGQRTLSLVAKPDGSVEWFYEPGTANYGINPVDFSANPVDFLQTGSASPEDFLGHIWPAWVSGSDPNTA